MPESGWVEVAGYRLEFERLGRAVDRAPCIVLLHEGLGCVRLWRDFPEALARATGWSVFSYSRAGYGRSSRCPLPRPLHYMRDEAVRVLPALLAEIGFSEGVLFGHSDGGTIAAINAAASPHPGLLGVVMMAPHFTTEDSGIAAIRAARDAYQDGHLRARLALYHGDNTEAAFRGWNDAWLDPRFRSFDVRHLLPHIAAPVCAIQGADDPYGSDLQLRLLESNVRPPLTVARLSDCAHAPHLERRSAVLDVVAGFLRTMRPLRGL